VGVLLRKKFGVDSNRNFGILVKEWDKNVIVQELIPFVG
jgi:hypothetical protein